MDRDNQGQPMQAGAPAPKQARVLLLGNMQWGVAWGLLLVLVGVALLLDHMGIVPFFHVYRFWPLLVVLFGAMNIATQSSRGFGVVMVVVGLLLQLNTLAVIHLTFRDFWPLVIIAVGVIMIWGSVESWTVYRKPTTKPKVDWTKPGATEAFRQQLEETYKDPNWLSAVAVFGGCERRYTGQHFEGGKAVSIFGGIELDFRDADMDNEAVLEINCIFGGVEIRVPPNWRVHSRSLPVFGGFEDKSGQRALDPNQEIKLKTLVVTGAVVFGGVEIRN
jgi:predicted membrane protein